MTPRDWLVVTPARDEAHVLPGLARSLAGQTVARIALWVVVDDSSTDGTATCVDWDTLPFAVEVLRRKAGGRGLAAGSELSAFLEGADTGLRRVESPARIVKLDADMVLAPDYVERVSAARGALVGGVIDDRRDRSQRHHVRGALKAYTREAFDVVRALPPALGFDVLDEVALRGRGLDVVVVESARARSVRPSGTSEGARAGARRQGVVARWSGYHPLYLLGRAIRVGLHRPYGVGALAFLVAYAQAGRGPFPAALRSAHRAEQSRRLRRLLAHPGEWSAVYAATSRPGEHG